MANSYMCNNCKYYLKMCIAADGEDTVDYSDPPKKGEIRVEECLLLPGLFERVGKTNCDSSLTKDGPNVIACNRWESDV